MVKLMVHQTLTDETGWMPSTLPRVRWRPDPAPQRARSALPAPHAGAPARLGGSRPNTKWV